MPIGALHSEQLALAEERRRQVEKARTAALRRVTAAHQEFRKTDRARKRAIRARARAVKDARDLGCPWTHIGDAAGGIPRENAARIAKYADQEETDHDDQR